MKNINDIYKIPAGTEIFSIALQETIYSKNDLFVRVADENAYGILQDVFQNIELQNYIGDDAIDYGDKKNGEIQIDWTKCELIRTEEQKRHLAMYEYEIDE